MVTRRGSKPEAVTHEQIMVELVALKQAGVDGRAKIHQRLDAGTARFDEIEKAVKPVTELVEAVGGEDQFKELVIDAARGLAALAWMGRKLKRLLVLVTVIGGAITAVIGMAKVIFWDFGKGG